MLPINERYYIAVIEQFHYVLNYTDTNVKLSQVKRYSTLETLSSGGIYLQLLNSDACITFPKDAYKSLQSKNQFIKSDLLYTTLIAAVGPRTAK